MLRSISGPCKAGAGFNSPERHDLPGEHQYHLRAGEPSRNVVRMAIFIRRTRQELEPTSALPPSQSSLLQTLKSRQELQVFATANPARYPLALGIVQRGTLFKHCYRFSGSSPTNDILITGFRNCAPANSIPRFSGSSQ